MVGAVKKIEYARRKIPHYIHRRKMLWSLESREAVVNYLNVIFGKALQIFSFKPDPLSVSSAPGRIGFAFPKLNSGILL